MEPLSSNPENTQTRLESTGSWLVQNSITIISSIALNYFSKNNYLIFFGTMALQGAFWYKIAEPDIKSFALLIGSIHSIPSTGIAILSNYYDVNTITTALSIVGFYGVMGFSLNKYL
jgi:hypothetical protein